MKGGEISRDGFETLVIQDAFYTITTQFRLKFDLK